MEGQSAFLQDYGLNNDVAYEYDFDTSLFFTVYVNRTDTESQQVVSYIEDNSLEDTYFITIYYINENTFYNDMMQGACEIEDIVPCEVPLLEIFGDVEESYIVGGEDIIEYLKTL
jgi:hypothetical protein